MRAGGCTVQPALTAEAAAVVKQAVSLARRRGNAQVTPLHVASAMLHHQHASPRAATTSPGLLRAACLRSHSHPLQCKALELCFNVALNRLPASASVASPLLAGHGHGHGVYYPPSLSNALVAAFKRAQAHQRRGFSENQAQQQQQAVVAVKIELEQLVISILDDPSVSRVMREAGFSSTQVKANVEHHAQSAIESSKPQNPNPNSPSPPPAADYQEAKPSKLVALDHQVQVREEDVAAILDCLAEANTRGGGKRVMVVAERAADAEAAARAAVERIRLGEAGQMARLRVTAAQVVTLAVSTFRGATRDEAERRLAELRRVVRQAAAHPVLLVVEDLAWTADFWAAAGRRASAACGGGEYYYCGVEHVVAEVRALACRGGEGVWVVGHGTYETNMRCREGHPSLETMWGLHTVAVPAGSLALTLTCANDADADSGAMAAVNHGKSGKARCDRAGNRSTSSPHCLSLLDAAGSCSGQQMMAVSNCCGDYCAATATKALPRSVVMTPSTTTTTSIPPWLRHCRDQQEPPHMKKWMSVHGGSPSRRSTALNISTSPCSSSISSYEQHYYHHPWLVATDEAEETSASNGAGTMDQEEAEERLRRTTTTSRFKEVSAENLKALCGALEKAVAPWQIRDDELVPEIASTVLRCRSGMSSSSSSAKRSRRDTWMLFLGGDADAKARVARELARLVFGSPDSLVSIGDTAVNRYASSSPSPARSGYSGEQRRKRPRPETTTTTSDDRLEALYDAVKENPRRVILMKRVDRADRRCHEWIRDAIESGVVRRRGGDSDGGETAVLGDAIVVLSCKSFDGDGDDESRIKKKAKTADGTRQEEEELNEDDDHQQRRKDASTSSSSSCFDLNMSVEEDVVDEERRCSGEAGGGQLLLKAVDRVLFFRSMEEL